MKVKCPWVIGFRTASIRVDSNTEAVPGVKNPPRVKIEAHMPEGPVTLYLTKKDARQLAYKLLALAG